VINGVHVVDVLSVLVSRKGGASRGADGITIRAVDELAGIVGKVRALPVA
jgi:hypothetical protein